MSTDVATLLQQAKCYLCLGISMAEALELALLAEIESNTAGSGGVPTIVMNANAGVGATGILAAGATDNGFIVTQTAGSSGLAAGVWFHVTFGQPFTHTPVAVFCPGSSLANTNSGANCYITNLTMTGFDFALVNLPGTGVAGTINFLVR